MAPDDPKTYRCRAGTETQRCSFHGTREELAEHADEMGHPRCICCGDALAWHEPQTCGRCASQVRDDLDAIAAAFAHLERVIGQGAYHGIAWNALTLAGDGAVTGGGTDDHIRYHDPAPAIAVLESCDRDWREFFTHERPPYHPLGHADRETPKQLLGNVLAYLRTHHARAVAEHPGFDDYAAEVRELRSRLEHVVGLADDPVCAPAECFDCGGQLVRTYQTPPDERDLIEARRELVDYRKQALAASRLAALSSRRFLSRSAFLEAKRAQIEPRCGREPEGLTDAWTCRRCERVYDQPSYFLALRSRRDECQGWVPVRLAAEVLRRPVQTVWWWQQQMVVASVCDPDSRQILVDWTEVAARAAQTRTDRKAS